MCWTYLLLLPFVVRILHDVTAGLLVTGEGQKEGRPTSDGMLLICEWWWYGAFPNTEYDMSEF